MAEIKTELDAPEADLDALESEVRSLNDERKAAPDTNSVSFRNDE